METTGDRWPLGSGGRIKHALGCVLAFELVHFVAAAVLRGALHVPRAQMWSGRADVIAVIAAAGVAGMLGVVRLGIVGRGRVSWRALGWHKHDLAGAVARGAVGALALGVVLLVPILALGLVKPAELVATLTGYSAMERLQFAVVGASAACVEESIFRGYLQPALVAKLGFVGGLLVASATFSAYHIFMGPDPLNLLAKLGFGVVLGLLRGRDRSLVAPMIAHFCFWQAVGSL